MRTVLRAFGLLVCLSSVFIPSAVAEAPFSFDTTPGKLPKTVVPRHYRIQLHPDTRALTTAGTVEVELEILKPVTEVVFNALELEISKATLDGTPAAAVTPHPETQTVTVTSSGDLSPGKHTLHLDFRGKIGRQAVGLYAEKYRVGGVEKQMLGTQMEPTDARRMFPCWDEPVFRAKFGLTVVVPDGEVAVSNMPVESERRGTSGLREVTFADTPPMASYLVVLCMGELEQLTGEVDGVKLGIWTTAGKRSQAAYAMEATRKIIHEYNEYFGVKYPLPKLDQIAVPGGFSGAMENWGGITYNEKNLLFDPATSSQETRERIFVIVAHEIAHQWFGNLVTMAWWDNLWLNEGFASWMETKCTDRYNPGWQVWLRANTGRESAMNLDARRATHPIQQAVRTESQAMDAFDEITYLKGQAFLRMLESYLGEEVFRKGIRIYMARHAYGSTTTADLWAALEEASGKPVGSIAGGWTTRPGFPLVTVASRDAGGGTEVTLNQERFLIGGTERSGEPWRIPLSVGPAAHASEAKSLLLDQASGSISLQVPYGTAVKINLGNSGFYRSAYSPDLTKAQAAVFPQLAAEDRVNLLCDAWAMAESGRGEVATYLDLVASLDPGETNSVIWETVIRNLEFLDRAEKGRPGQAAFQRWAVERLRVPFQRLGWEPGADESSNDALLRSALITSLGTLGDPAVISQARVRFAQFLKDPTTLPPNLRTPVCRVVGRHADAATWEQLRSLARSTDSTEERDRYYDAFQHATDPALARRTLDLALTEERPFAQWFPLVPDVAQGHPDLAWEFARTNAVALLAKVPDGGAFATRNTYFGFVAAPSLDAARAAELEALVALRVGDAAAAETAKTSEQIRLNAAFAQREIPQVDAWIARKRSVR
ncbi:MAG: M1 family metallopeptidase [Verrucomicrobiota bacterium]